MYLLGEWGFGYDDWQSFTMAGLLRERPDGLWAAKEVGLEVPRQNGKGEIYEGRECLGLFFLGERKLIHSAHEFATASEALDRMDDRIGANPQLKRLVKSVKRSHGEEGIYLRDGRKLLYKTRTKGAGRGFSCDFLGLDEAMYLAEAFLGALMPVISARPNPQMVYGGSPVDRTQMDHGIVFSRLRARAMRGDAGRMAYFGWSPAYSRGWQTPDDVPREATADPEVIAEANPALGIRIPLEHVLETEREAMDHRTFCVERLGVGDWPEPDGSSSQVISDTAWLARRTQPGPTSVMVDPVCVVYDVSPDRSSAAIGVAGYRPDGEFQVEIADHRPGTGWVGPRLVEILSRQQVFWLGCDERGPAGALVQDLLNLGLPVETVNAQEYAKAWGVFVDAVDQGTVWHLGSPELASAVKGAEKRPLGDGSAWSRRSSSVDISPLVAVTIALWRCMTFGAGSGGFEW